MAADKDLLDDNIHWYKDAIIYELHIKAFKDGSGDGIGDFKGLMQKLDYLESETNWRRRSPVFWANFIFIGDQAPVYPNYAFLWWGLGGLAAAGAGWLVYKIRRRRRPPRRKERNTSLVN